MTCTTMIILAKPVKQPLYYDALLSASGPYKQYKTISWKTTWYFMNQTACPVDIFISPPLNAANECDTVAEADNFPGVKRLRLTAATGSKKTARSLQRGI